MGRWNKKSTKGITFRGVDINYQAGIFACPKCGLEAGTIDTAGATQKVIADAYRINIGLLTGDKNKVATDIARTNSTATCRIDEYRCCQYKEVGNRVNSEQGDGPGR